MKVKYLVLALCAVLSAGSLAACQNTVHGAGQDLENMGEGLQHEVPPKY